MPRLARCNGCSAMYGSGSHRRYVLWHDRALFHFMISEEDREAYLQTLERATDPERAFAIFATFAPDGPLQCSGLPVTRYDAADLRAALGIGWQMIDEERESHTTPSGRIQPSPGRCFAVGPS